MPFGLKKKDDEEASRNALFGSRKKEKGTPPAQNPYAAPAGKDPYGAPPPYQGGGSNYNRDKSPAVTGPGQSYGAQQRAPGGGGGYGSQGGGYGGQDKYGSQGGGGGYGSQGGSYGASGGYGGGGDRYGSGGQDQGARRPGGYGGMLRSLSPNLWSTTQPHCTRAETTQ